MIDNFARSSVFSREFVLVHLRAFSSAVNIFNLLCNISVFWGFVKQTCGAVWNADYANHVQYRAVVVSVTEGRDEGWLCVSNNVSLLA